MKEETLEEVAERLIKLNRQDAFYEGAKWQQERSYSEEDMIEFGEWMKILPLTISGFVIKDTNIVIKTTKELLKYWFEKFKKK